MVGEYDYMPARYVITAWRHWSDRALVAEWIERMRSHAVMALGADDNHTMWGIGDCPTGGDYFGRGILKNLGLNYREFTAQWSRFGNSAGPRRNREMVDTVNPTHVLAFVGRTSKGAVDCADYAQATAHVYRIYGKGHLFTSTPPGGTPESFDWSRLNVQ